MIRLIRCYLNRNRNRPRVLILMSVRGTQLRINPHEN